MSEIENEEMDEDQDIPLTSAARYSVTLGATFSFRGHSHWPKVEIEDSIGQVVDHDDETDEDFLRPETAEEMQYRVEETAHRRLNAVIARMKRDIDQRAADEAALRASRITPAATSE